MEVRTATFFECKVRYDKTMEDVGQKKVTETYVVNALSFAEAEEKVFEEMSAYVSGKLDVTAIKIAPYSEIFFSDEDKDDKFYRVDCKFITLDEKTDKEKKTTVHYLVQAATVDGARKNTDEVMGKSMIDYVITSVIETKIEDVFAHP